jgi:hypothetical protein
MSGPSPCTTASTRHRCSSRCLCVLVLLLMLVQMLLALVLLLPQTKITRVHTPRSEHHVLILWTPTPQHHQHVHCQNVTRWVQLQGLLTPSEVASALHAVEELKAALPNGVPRHHQFYDVINKPKSLKQIQVLHTHRKFFADLAGPRAMGRLASVLLGEPAVLKNIQYFNKAPGTSEPTPAHQDGCVSCTRCSMPC